MARKCLIERQNKRIKLALKYMERREILKKAGDKEALAKLPRNSNPVRLRNRCPVTGRGNGYIRKFGMSRITFREHASRGQIPGVTKSSW